MKTKKLGLVCLLLGALLAIQGCGGGGSGSMPVVGTAPNSQTNANIAKHLSGFPTVLAGQRFMTFTSFSSGPHFSTPLGLWVVNTVTATTFTETFYVDQAETQPAGSATYTLDLSTKTLSGTISITQGKYAGLSGTYSQTVANNGTVGTYNFTLPSGTIVSCQFSIVALGGGNFGGTATETVTQPGGYSETVNFVYKADKSMTITASDTNGYSSVFKIASDFSGTGTVAGPDPGLPATVTWNSVGTGQIKFANGLVVPFTNWQFP